jgi:hypothetical protein
MLNKIQLVIKLLCLLYLNSVFSQTLFEYASNGNCTFYREMEKVKNCGSNGYLISYGKYILFISNFHGLVS